MNKLRLGAVICGIAACVAATSMATAKTKVYLVAGQSNGLGAGDYTEGQFDSTEMATMEGVDVYFSRDGLTYGWETLGPGLGSDYRPTINGGKPCFGPEITFGVGMQNANPTDRIVLVKYAVDGTSLDGFWKPSANYLYPRLITGAQEAMTLLNGGTVDGGDTGGTRSVTEEVEFSGMIWMQGESDAMYASSANAYEQNLTDLVNAVRTDLGVADLPFVIGRINANREGFEYRDPVRQAQYNVSQSLDNVAMIDTDDLPDIGDLLHYNYDGQDTLGYRFADAMVGLTVPEPSCMAMIGLAFVGLIRRR